MTSLAAQVRQLSYADVFERLLPAERDAILSRPGALDELRQLVSDEELPPLSRFICAELLYLAGAPGWPDEEARRVLPAIYRDALAASVDGSAWGIPGRWTHPATEHAIALGAPVVPALAPLLSDGRRLRYTGSKRAMLGDYYGVRVRDVAAFIIAGVLGVPYAAADLPADRDPFITTLAARVRQRA